MKKLVVHFVLVSSFLLALVTYAQEPGEPVAYVVALQGVVNVTGRGGDNRVLERRAEINVGDILETTNNAWVQLRFSDNARLTLNCDSRLQLVDYQYLDRNSDRVSLRLLQGRMRTITGAIQRSNYSFSTELAEVTVGGTDFEVEIVSESENIFGVYDGAITVSNEIDSVFIGLDRAFDFARVVLGAPPERLPNSPFRISTALLSGNQGQC